MRTPLHFTSQQALLVQSMRAFVSSEIQPIAATLQRGARAHPQLLELLESLAEFGLPGGAVATELGGMGLDWTSLAHLFEELARGSDELAEIALANLLTAWLLASRDTSRDGYLADLLEGRCIVGFALDHQGLSTTVQRGGFLLDGTVEQVRGAAWADLLICSANNGNGGQSCFLLDRHADRIDISHSHSSGSASAPLSNLQVTQTFLTEERWLGDATTIARLHDLRKLFKGMNCVAKAQQVLDHVVEQTREHTTGNIQPLLALHLAEMATAVSAARQMIVASLQRLDEGQASRTEIQMASLLSARTLAKIDQLAARIDPSHRSIAMTLDQSEHDADAQAITRALFQA
ncbi:acyl-CoA/acyl-ACP dehydrogenase [Pseudomonas sp. LS44]|uniref:acyl-CoA dehydrogenase family protein n=1 Tax=Pseudomonas sp. LS44 TaxID=1357074 RepID=UPI00215B6AA2|nr:acyl-CoA dehydrogenase family protein [Pseudomonas sp. LS44]UVE16116.1 acyl-CoA/acyl-ACP dehydrogenase [Pseudomonas sp. LS44]